MRGAARHLMSEMPDMRSGLLLHAAWLADSGGGKLEKSFNCRLE